MGYATFHCHSCGRNFNERTGTPYNNLQFPTEIVFVVVLWRLRYKLSLRDLSEMFLERGFGFTHETVREWEERFAPIITAQLRLERKRDWKRKTVSSWHCDETYIKIKGQQYYLYRAIDKLDNLIDWRLARTRDLEAAKAFFKQALEVVGGPPKKITTDKHASYPKAIKKVLGCKVEQRTSKYLNNFQEQDHRKIKGRLKPMLGLQTFESAARFCSAYDEQQHYFRYREFKNDTVPLVRQRTLYRVRFAHLQKMFLAA